MEKARVFLNGYDVEGLKGIRAIALDLIKEKKVTEKAEMAEKALAIVEYVNELINTNKLAFGSRIIVSYNGNDVEAVVENTPSEKSKNLLLTSDAFVCEGNKRYTAKSAFVGFADGAGAYVPSVEDTDGEDYLEDDDDDESEDIVLD